MHRFVELLKRVGSILLNLIIITAIAYIVFNIGKSIHHNYEVNKKISELKLEIEKLFTQKKALENLILYYQTKTFKELEARKNLGLKKPDEKIVIMPENDGATEEKKEEILSRKKENNQDIDHLPNYLLWWNFIIKG